MCTAVPICIVCAYVHGCAYIICGTAEDNGMALPTCRECMLLAQVVMPLDKKKVDASNATLVEVGPRCALRPIKIFEGSFGGRVLYDNPEFVSPNVVRRLIKQQKAGKYAAKVQQKAKRRAHEEENVLPVSEVDEVFKLAG